LIATQAMAVTAADLLARLVAHRVQAVLRLRIANLKRRRMITIALSEVLNSSHLAEEVIVQWHLTLGVNVFEIPSEALALELVSQL
jgi:hypothetical protein